MTITAEITFLSGCSVNVDIEDLKINPRSKTIESGTFRNNKFFREEIEKQAHQCGSWQDANAKLTIELDCNDSWHRYDIDLKIVSLLEFVEFYVVSPNLNAC